MKNTMFENLSPMEVCRKMSAICQQSADETAPGLSHERLQIATNKLKDEADTLANSARLPAEGTETRCAPPNNA
jgi:hypothetical protein